MTELVYSHFRTGKVFMQTRMWEHLKCKHCDVELLIDISNEFEEVKVCPICGKRHMLIKKIRKGEVNDCETI